MNQDSSDAVRREKKLVQTNFLPISMAKFAIPYSDKVAKIRQEELLKPDKLLISLFKSMSYFFIISNN